MAYMAAADRHLLHHHPRIRRLRRVGCEAYAALHSVRFVGRWSKESGGRHLREGLATGRRWWIVGYKPMNAAQKMTENRTLPQDREDFWVFGELFSLTRFLNQLPVPYFSSPICVKINLYSTPQLPFNTYGSSLESKPSHTTSVLPSLNSGGRFARHVHWMSSASYSEPEFVHCITSTS